MPPGCYGRVADRSGLAVKHNISVAAGVIDPDYRGEILVVLRNFSSIDFKVEKNVRFAQLVLESCVAPKVEVVSELTDTARQEKGFGSTGEGVSVATR